MKQIQKIIARVTGNFGISFFGPLAGGSIANTIFPNCITFHQTLIIATVAAIIVTGLAISKEIAQFGEAKNKN